MRRNGNAMATVPLTGSPATARDLVRVGAPEPNRFSNALPRLRPSVTDADRWMSQ